MCLWVMLTNQGLDCLKDPKKPYQEKVNLLLQAWEGLATYKKPAAADANDGFTLDDITERLYRCAFLPHTQSF